MGAFEYNALDEKGRERTGVLEGDTARQVRQRLREKGLVPLSVDEVVRRESGGTRRPLVRRRVSATDLALITRQLATLVRAGLPLEEVFHAVARQTEKPRLQSMLLAVRSRITEGHDMATGLADFPHVFPELYRATVGAGEQSGYLEAVLERLADYTETRQQLHQRIQLALLYPVILTLVALAVVTGLLAYVVPQVVQVFTNLNQQLPVLTRGLIAVSDFLRANWGLILVVLIAAGAGTTYVLRLPGPRRQFHRFQLRIPLLARLVRGLNTARFARTLSILVESGVPVLEALRIAAQVMSNLPMRAAVEDAAARVREGATLHGALEASGLFPPMIVSLIASGEASGNLEGMLDRAAVSQEREIETLISALLGLFEPLLILLMGGMVLVIVIAILLPIFDLNQLVK
ncbi:MAG: type II secretion system protein GspF [Chromatiales bacterium 21-64-14]|nr:MAG: type II secretion system protein GspF [Chromatiales bacterium 21-64-14]HQU16218.1 type II secretion system inner membrane protein GspF [Gammaproteobacteria bacterium]